jgi:two-component system, OmpR family, response regulator ResD
MDTKILIADDDQVFRELVCDIIKKEGYLPIEAGDGKQALDLFFAAQDIDLLILDVMMPCCDGWEALAEIRKYSDVPVIMLTALGDDKHEALGLRQGADDYITKPFSYEVFVARLHAMLRKVHRDRLAELRLGDLKVNQAAQRVTAGDAEVNLNRKEYSLLVYLLQNKNRVLTREQILDRLWGYDFEGDIRTIDTHIKTLRAKLSGCGEYIQTVRGSGYMIEVNE